MYTVDSSNLPGAGDSGAAAFALFAGGRFWYKGRRPSAPDGGDYMSRFIDYMLYNVFEPGLDWVLHHPIISVVAVVLLIYVSVRNYKML